MNAKAFHSVLSLSLLLAATCFAGYAAGLVLDNVPAKVYISPGGGCTEAIVDEINNAKAEILVQAYLFTSAPIAKALLKAHKRGVRVEAILDRRQRNAKYRSATFLANSRRPTYIDSAHAIAHNKLMIIDGGTVDTGSFNFPKSAEDKNAENLLIVKSEELAKLYKDNWERHREHSEEYAPRY